MIAYIRLKDILDIQTNFEGADFWIIRKGDEKKIGKPTREFLSSHIGFRLNDVGKTILDPNYLYYVFEYLYGEGVWRSIARGTLSLKHITVSDAKNFSIPIQVPENFGE